DDQRQVGPVGLRYATRICQPPPQGSAGAAARVCARVGARGGPCVCPAPRDPSDRPVARERRGSRETRGAAGPSRPLASRSGAQTAADQHVFVDDPHGELTMALPTYVKREVRSILDREARRLLDEQMNVDALSATTNRSDVDAFDKGADQLSAPIP